MKILCKNKFWELNKEYNLDKILYLLIDRPYRITTHSNNLYWTNKKIKWHREYDLPALIRNDGYVSWYKNHNRYREGNKYVAIDNDDIKLYYINGEFIKGEK